MNTAIFTVIYSESLPYFGEFIDSLEKQTCRDFTLFLMNDGISGVENLLSRYSGKVEVQNTTGNPSAIRKAGIRWILENNMDAIVFADSDDCLMSNRVEISNELLSEADIVVNDLKLFGEKIQSPVFLLNGRFADGALINKSDIFNSNCMGLSNTAMSVSSIPEKLSMIPDDLIAFDWTYFSLCLHEGAKAVFTDRTATLYRQHENNLAISQSLTDAQVMRGVRVKCDNYRFMSKYSDDYRNISKKYDGLHARLVSDETYRRKYCDETVKKADETSLWWNSIKTGEELGL